MSDLTGHYGLQKLNEDDLSINSWKFSDADRDLEDNLLYLGAEGHRHTGAASSVNAPTLAPTLSLDTSSGTISPSTRVYYRYTYLDGFGIETLSSPETWLDTPSAVLAPATPTLGYSTTGGTLQPGNYYYVLSAYQNFDNLETLASNIVYIAIPYTTSSNSITVTFPTLPSGATGFNIYRKGPGNVGYRYLDTANMTVATPPSSYTDDGSVAEDPDRPIPSSNTTLSQNSIQVAIPGATPTLPAGYSWRIYRTYQTGDYTNSLLTTIPPSATPILSYVDTGINTSFGEPPIAGATVGNPTKVLLTGAAEVQGVLPLENLPASVTTSGLVTDFITTTGFPSVILFQIPGSVIAGPTSFVWKAPSDGIWLAVQISLRVGSVPAVRDVIIDIHKYTLGATPTSITIFTDQAARPKIGVGQQVGGMTGPAAFAISAGDLFTIEIDQNGGGSTPTDRDLMIQLVVSQLFG